MISPNTMSDSTRIFKVLVVDDSAVICHLLTSIINAHPQFKVVGTAPDPYIARDMIKALNPDLLTLDIEMPKMNGLQFLRNLMRLRPMPVVMISSITTRGATHTMEALRIGAVDVIEKPDFNTSQSMDAFSRLIYEKLLIAASVKKTKLLPRSNTYPGPAYTPQGKPNSSRRLLAIGASTGGTIALQEIFSQLPATTPGTVVVQHIPGAFSQAFADSLDKCTAMKVQQAKDGDIVKQGHVYIAPGEQHLHITWERGAYRCCLLSTAPVNRHRPSVDILFESVAKCAMQGSVGLLLTGMGKDGAQGLLAMRKTGYTTVAQDEFSSVVWGMPGTAVALGAAEHVKSLESIPNFLTETFRGVSTDLQLSTRTINRTYSS